jgi:hypothetical protein
VNTTTQNKGNTVQSVPLEISLRDYFAAQVRVSMGMWTPYVPKFDENDSPVNLSMKELEKAQRRVRAAWAYAEADAMIAARATQESTP